jgi:diguanylate cyclase (GGDEF)-like protein
MLDSETIAGPAVSPKWLQRDRLRLSIGLAAVIILACVSTGAHSGAATPTVWRVAYNDYPPYVSPGPDGIPIGFAAEIFTAAARKAHVEFRWVEIPGGADKAFAAGTADVYPLMTINPARESEFYMSLPWWENHFALISNERRVIPDARAANGKLIGTRLGAVEDLTQRLFPGAKFVRFPTLASMEEGLCSQAIDGFVSDIRLLQGQLLKRTPVCAGQELHITSIPDSKLNLGTGSTKAAAEANDRIFREIAKLALNGSLSRSAAKWGVYTPYDTTRLRQTLEAEAKEQFLIWVVGAMLVILAISLFQTNMVRRAKREMEWAQAKARETQLRFDEFMKHTPAINFIKDEKGRLVYSNEVLRGDKIGPPTSAGTPSFFISERLCQGDEEVLALGRGVETTETIRVADGTSRHFLVLKFLFGTAAGAKLLGGVALDVTARILAEKELEFHAKSDNLTGLPNRRCFMTELGKALDAAHSKSERVAVGFIDLDGFKRVNDLLGHEAGDELLKRAAARLKQICAWPDTVARLGGDEFTFFLRDVDAARLHKTTRAILESLREVFRIGGQDVSVSASIGVSVFPEQGTNSQQLLRNADLAMYAAKKNGKGRIELLADVGAFTCLPPGPYGPKEVGEAAISSAGQATSSISIALTQA